MVCRRGIADGSGRCSGVYIAVATTRSPLQALACRVGGCCTFPACDDLADIRLGLAGHLNGILDLVRAGTFL